MKVIDILSEDYQSCEDCQHFLKTNVLCVCRKHYQIYRIDSLKLYHRFFRISDNNNIMWICKDFEKYECNR